MRITDFNFNLPQDLIARYPLPQRSASRLLCLNAQNGHISHRQFTDVMDLVDEGDLLIFNDTKVIPARLHGQKSTGGHVEILVERILSEQRILAQVRCSKPPRIGDYLLFNKLIQLEVANRVGQFYELRYNGVNSILDMIESIGEIPLPPYMHRLPDESDKERYQTIYAKHKGSVAAPTAGFHFDDAIIRRLEEKKVNMEYLTLHIGAGTFTPIRAEDIREHKMHAEYIDVPWDLCEKIKETKARGKRVIAVGTTSMRALETACQGGDIAPYHGETSIFIYPGYEFRCVDALITNLHLPASSLLILVCAFSGREYVLQAYQEAVDKKYRFYSYGDAMWVTKAQL
jgi:S-adenosylmethionine:tRNA ribosyltransferase-isomerase